MPGAVPHTFGGIEFNLYADGTAFAPALRTLFIADVHLGKSGHFRTFGIPTPKGIHDHAMASLHKAIGRHSQAKVVFLGDLFHNLQNKETADLRSLIATYPDSDFHLIIGNHDIDLPDWQELQIHSSMEFNGLVCLHEPPGSNFNANISFDASLIADRYPDNYLLCGHIHPGVMLRGKGRGRLRMKAFYFGEQIGILPAFGPFTGAHALQEQGQYFGIAEGQVLSLF